jgi:hypothetical protein
MKLKGLRALIMAAMAGLAIALSSSIGDAADAPRKSTGLNQPYPVTLGQMIATSASTILETLKPVDAPMMAIFNGEKLEIWVLGARSTPEGAKETLEIFQRKGWLPLVAMIQGLYGVKLREDQVVVIYRNRGEDIQEVMRRENGTYVVK